MPIQTKGGPVDYFVAQLLRDKSHLSCFYCGAKVGVAAADLAEWRSVIAVRRIPVQLKLHLKGINRQTPCLQPVFFCPRCFKKVPTKMHAFPIANVQSMVKQSRGIRVGGLEAYRIDDPANKVLEGVLNAISTSEAAAKDRSALGAREDTAADRDSSRS